MPAVRLLLTRGTSWQQVRDWRVLEMAEQPNLLTCRKRAQISGTLTPYEAFNVTLRRFDGAEVYMWREDVNYIPGRSLQGHEAVRIVAVSPRRLPA